MGGSSISNLMCICNIIMKQAIMQYSNFITSYVLENQNFSEENGDIDMLSVKTG